MNNAFSAIMVPKEFFASYSIKIKGVVPSLGTSIVALSNLYDDSDFIFDFRRSLHALI